MLTWFQFESYEDVFMTFGLLSNGWSGWLIRSSCSSKIRCTEFESWSGRMFVIGVVHMQCSKLFKGLDYTMLSMVLFIIKNPWSNLISVGHIPDFGLHFVTILPESADVFDIHSLCQNIFWHCPDHPGTRDFEGWSQIMRVVYVTLWRGKYDPLIPKAGGAVLIRIEIYSVCTVSIDTVHT